MIPFLNLTLARSFVDYIDEVHLNAKAFKFPVLVLVAKDDKVVCNDAIRKFFT